jgi:hypothetical protein
VVSGFHGDDPGVLVATNFETDAGKADFFDTSCTQNGPPTTSSSRLLRGPCMTRVNLMAHYEANSRAFRCSARRTGGASCLCCKPGRTPHYDQHRGWFSRGKVWSGLQA